MTKATRAMYPLSSSMDKKKNKTTMMGRKLSTLPTPANTPSMMQRAQHRADMCGRQHIADQHGQAFNAQSHPVGQCTADN